MAVYLPTSWLSPHFIERKYSRCPRLCEQNVPSTISVSQDDRERVILGDSGQYVVKLDLVHYAGKNFMTVHYRINLRRNDALVISQSQVASCHRGVNALLFCLAQASQWELSFSNFPACADLLSYQALLAACSFLVTTLAASGLDFSSFPHLSWAFYILHKAPLICLLRVFTQHSVDTVEILRK